MKQIWMAALFVFFALPAFAAGQDSGLYDPLPPEGAAFVRFINTSEIPMDAFSDGKKRTSVAPMSASPYFVVMSAAVNFALGTQQVNGHPDKDGYYSVFIGSEGAHILKDPVDTNRAKAHVMFYNLRSATPLSLKTIDGTTDVVSNVAQDQAGARAINPVKVTFGVFNGPTKIGDLPEDSLERGINYSAVYVAPQKVIWVQASTDTVH